MQYKPSKLKPLKNLGALDGERDKADIPRDTPLKSFCSHNEVKMISGSEIRCKCGAGWQGAEIQKLYLFLKNRK